MSLNDDPGGFHTQLRALRYVGSKIRTIALAFRCLYCGVFFCATCAEIHFGMTQQQHDQTPP